MKKYLFVLLLLYTSICVAQTAFDQYPGFETEVDSNAKGKGKGHPTPSNVPEPATYGVFMVAAVFSFVYFKRRKI